MDFFVQKCLRCKDKMLVYRLFWIVLFQILIDASKPIETFGQKLLNLDSDNTFESERNPYIFNKCCEDSNLFDIVNRRCIAMKNETYSGTFLKNKKLSLG